MKLTYTIKCEINITKDKTDYSAKIQSVMESYYYMIAQDIEDMIHGDDDAVALSFSCIDESKYKF